MTESGSSADPIEHEESGHRGAFFIRRDERRVAEMTYTRSPSQTIIDHTQVDDVLRGTGAGRRLVAAAVEWARREHVRLLPLCPFARSVFDKTPEFADVLKT
ncbi:MAG: GNAT family N-acetyltransferase [Lautropia sp.]